MEFIRQDINRNEKGGHLTFWMASFFKNSTEPELSIVLIFQYSKMKNKTINISLFVAGILIWSACSDKTPQSDGLVYNQNGQMTLFGNKIETADLKFALKEALAEMPAVPDSIPVHFEGEVGMGTRGEIETQVGEAVFEAKHAGAVADAVHGFYKWYLQQPGEMIDFTDNTGKYLKLDPSKLDAYLAVFKNSGLISDEFIESEKAFYKACEAIWQNETEGPYTCLEADRFTCLQDAPELLTDHFTKAPVEVIYLSENRVAAKIQEEDWEDDFELTLENGKWLLAKFGCDLLPD